MVQLDDVRMSDKESTPTADQLTIDEILDLSRRAILTAPPESVRMTDSEAAAAYFNQLTHPFEADAYGNLCVPDADCRPSVSKVLKGPLEITLDRPSIVLLHNPNAPLPYVNTIWVKCDPANGLPGGYEPWRAIPWSDKLESNYQCARIVSTGLRATSGMVSTVSVPLSGYIYHGRLTNTPDVETITPSIIENLTPPGCPLMKSRLSDGVEFIGGYPDDWSYKPPTSFTFGTASSPWSDTFMSSSHSTVMVLEDSPYNGGALLPNSVVRDLSGIAFAPGGAATVGRFNIGLCPIPNYMGRVRVDFNIKAAVTGVGGALELSLRSFYINPGFDGTTPIPSQVNNSLWAMSPASTTGNSVRADSGSFILDLTQGFTKFPSNYKTFELNLISQSADAFTLGSGSSLNVSVTFIDDTSGCYNSSSTIAIITGYQPTTNQNLSLDAVANLEAVPNIALARQTRGANMAGRIDLDEFSLSRSVFCSLPMRVPGFRYTTPLDSPFAMRTLNRVDLKQVAMADWKRVFTGIGKGLMKNRGAIASGVRSALTKDYEGVLRSLGDIKMGDMEVGMADVGMMDDRVRMSDANDMTPEEIDAITRRSAAAVEQPMTNTLAPLTKVSGLANFKRGKFAPGGLKPPKTEALTDTDYVINYGVAAQSKDKSLHLAIIGSKLPVMTELHEGKERMVVSGYREVVLRSPAGDKELKVHANEYAFPGFDLKIVPAALFYGETRFPYLTIVPFSHALGVPGDPAYVTSPPSGQSASALAVLTVFGHAIHAAISGDIDELGLIQPVNELPLKCVASQVAKQLLFVSSAQGSVQLSQAFATGPELVFGGFTQRARTFGVIVPDLATAVTYDQTARTLSGFKDAVSEVNRSAAAAAVQPSRKPPAYTLPDAKDWRAEPFEELLNFLEVLKAGLPSNLNEYSVNVSNHRSSVPSGSNAYKDLVAGLNQGAPFMTPPPGDGCWSPVDNDAATEQKWSIIKAGVIKAISHPEYRDSWLEHAAAKIAMSLPLKKPGTGAASSKKKKKEGEKSSVPSGRAAVVNRYLDLFDKP
jgi:hypothetical protein